MKGRKVATTREAARIVAEFEASVRPFELQYKQQYLSPHWMDGNSFSNCGPPKDTLIEGPTGTPGKVGQVSPSTVVGEILVILVATIVVTRHTNPKLKLTIPPIVAVNPMILVITISNRRKPTCYARGEVASYLGPYSAHHASFQRGIRAWYPLSCACARLSQNSVK